MPPGLLNLDAPGDLWLPPETYDAQELEQTPGTPWWWLSRLNVALDQQWAEMKVYDSYYEGRHPMAYTSAKFREAFGSLFRTFADNWCPIIVDAPVERLVVEGFRFAEDKADTAAWDIWQANDLDVESIMCHTEAVKLGEAAIIVDAPLEDGGYPVITVEHPSQVVVCAAPGSRRQRAAALKRWIDQDGYANATVYLPAASYKFRTDRPVKVGQHQKVRWVERPGVPFETGNPAAPFVPVIPVRNNPGMLHGGRSDLQVGLPIQDAINKECNDMLVASEFAAYRQRVMTGVETPTDPITNQPVKLNLDASRLFTVADPEAKVFDLAASDLSNYTGAIAMLVQHLAAQTRTPPHYLLGQVVNASGDALKAAEAGLVQRTIRKQGDFADSWEEALRLAFLIRGGAGDKQRAETIDAETIWRDAEMRSEAQLVDAGVKKQQIGIPLEQIWADIGYSPQQIQRFAKLKGLPDRTPASPVAPDATTELPGATGA